MGSVNTESISVESYSPELDEVEQLQLFHIENEEQDKDASFCDPAFMGNKMRPIHRWVPWVAGFSAEFVDDVLNRYIEKPGTIIDPFAGVGTTLTEAVIHGHDAVGYEINPYAALASRLKSNAHLVDDEILDSKINRFVAYYRQCLSSNYDPHSIPPPGFRTRAPFYSPKVLRKVLIVWDFIQTIDEETIRELFKLAFAATMVSYSNYSYEPSLSRRVSSGKSEIEDALVGQIMATKLRNMRDDIRWFKTAIREQEEPKEAKVFCTSFFHYREHIKPNTIDLLITSPPYLNNYHYLRNTRPQLYWLGFIDRPKDMKSLEENNFGTYWQTARDKDCIDLDFRLPKSDLEERLNMLRRVNPEKGIYGGNGWANYAAAYFNDCHRFAKAIKYVLKPGGTAVVVIGNSILQGIPIATEQYFASISELVGLDVVNIDIPRSTRVGNSIVDSDVRVGKAKSKTQLYEAVVELRNIR